jgi:hypothetical protein
MSGAILTNQFRILNSQNFINSIGSETDSYYLFLGLPNPIEVGFGRTSTWNTNPPAPIDNFNYLNNAKDNILFGKKITSVNVRRLIRNVSWTSGTTYEMYRHDYSLNNLSPVTNQANLYNANYYVINSDYKVYICIDNGSSVDNPSGNPSIDEPTFVSLEPSKSGESGDGYVWKYLYTVSPSDIIKFDSTEYIPVPSDWNTSTKSEIVEIRENGDSEVNNNQLKKIYINNRGENYDVSTGGALCDVLGDGSGGQVFIEINSLGEIQNATVTKGGSGYSFAVVDLDEFNNSVGTGGTFAELIPIIPPSKGHGYNLYNELGADKLLIYGRFDDSTKDFPIDTKFSQIGILKNPESYDGSLFTGTEFSGLYALKLKEDDLSVTVGDEISQTYTDDDGNEVIAKGYVASYDTETKVLKYFRDRSLFYNDSFTTKDFSGISIYSKVVDFKSTESDQIDSIGGTIDTSFSGNVITIDSKIINLGVTFDAGISKPEINKQTGDVIYIDNRPLVSRNSRQKEDIKVILEF